MATEKRLKLHQMLVDILGNENVYFQPPESVKLKYPCILYFRKQASESPADNMKYQFWLQYDLILVDKNPDDGLMQKLAVGLPYCRYDRHYVSDNLHHDVFQITIP